MLNVKAEKRKGNFPMIFAAVYLHLHIFIKTQTWKNDVAFVFAHFAACDSQM